MERFSLELTLTATEGSIHNLGNLVCLAWLSASTYNPLHQNNGKAAVLARTANGYGELAANAFTVPIAALATLVNLMRQLGVPEHPPGVQARNCNSSGWQNLVIDLTLDGKQGRIALSLQYGGLEGEDFELTCAMLNQLFVLLEVPYLKQWIESGDA